MIGKRENKVHNSKKYHYNLKQIRYGDLSRSETPKISIDDNFKVSKCYEDKVSVDNGTESILEESRASIFKNFIPGFGD